MCESMDLVSGTISNSNHSCLINLLLCLLWNNKSTFSRLSKCVCVREREVQDVSSHFYYSEMKYDFIPFQESFLGRELYPVVV